MRLKTKLVLAISLMVMALVTGLSSIYVSQIVSQRIVDDSTFFDFVASDIRAATENALEVDTSNARNAAAERQLIVDVLQGDPGLNSQLASAIGDSKIIFDVAVVDTENRILISTGGLAIGDVLPPRENFADITKIGFLRQIQWIYGKLKIYEVSAPIVREGKPFGTVRVGVVNALLKDQLKEQLDRALEFSAICIFVSLLLAAGLSNFALRPLEVIARRLDLMTAQIASAPVAKGRQPRGDEVRVVTSKIDRLGREIRDVKEVFSALKENLDQIMANLQDGLVLFTRDWRAVLVSASAETFLCKPRGDVLGSAADAIFAESTPLGRVVLEAISARQPIAAREVETEDHRRVQVSLDFIEEGGERMGALLTMRDAESVRRIESEIELSRRLAAIGRLTSGVAHEVRNPINAIVVHLEILRQKLQQADPDVQRHMSVIGSEIQRLDRVVQMLVDFTRPVELRLADVDLRRVVDDVVMLSAPDAERHSVELVRQLPPEPLMVKVDADLVKQAVLNVVLNGVQAMPEGGQLTISARRDERGVQLDIGDAGQGIPPEIRDKVFDLYFTTKKSGSGIGLAMTFRVMQLHNGSVEFDTGPQGTTFHLRLPAPEAAPREALVEVARNEAGA